MITIFIQNYRIFHDLNDALYASCESLYSREASNQLVFPADKSSLVETALLSLLPTHVKISQLVASLQTSHQQVVFARLVTSCQQVRYKMLTCNNLVDIECFHSVPRIKTTKKLAAMLVYVQKNIFKILLSWYTNMAAMTSHANTLLSDLLQGCSNKTVTIMI